MRGGLADTHQQLFISPDSEQGQRRGRLRLRAAYGREGLWLQRGDAKVLFWSSFPLLLLLLFSLSTTRSNLIYQLCRIGQKRVDATYPMLFRLRHVLRLTHRRVRTQSLQIIRFYVPVFPIYSLGAATNH